ncbi:MAG: hypothetical protein ACHRHE_19495 [Tepidisphaerales bacterium]
MKRLLLLTFALSLSVFAAAPRTPLDPLGKIHIAIGIPNTVDPLKTIVEVEGVFSPGSATYGIYVWFWDGQKLIAPTMPGIKSTRKLHPDGYLLPTVEWGNEDGRFRQRYAATRVPCKGGQIGVTALEIEHFNDRLNVSKGYLYVALRSLGPAGGKVHHIEADPVTGSLLVDGHPAIIPLQDPDASRIAETVGVAPADQIVELALKGDMPHALKADCPDGNACGVIRYRLPLMAGSDLFYRFLFPVLPGRRAASHQWDGKNPWAQLDDALPNATGQLQPDPPLEFYRSLNADDLFKQAESDWKNLTGRFTLKTPDPRWEQALRAITGHLMMCMNDNAPDVAVINYNVFNRDGMYAANAFQKVGRFDLSAAAIDYFLAHPFNGRVQPEADNPGQILWIMGQHCRFSRDDAWLARVYPSLQKLTALVRYYRTTPGPHWVQDDALEFGDAVPKEKRKLLKPGSCDGFHPEYTQAYDIAGLRQAAFLAQSSNHADDAKAWSALADEFFKQYAGRFEKNLPSGYGSYSVLWPCALYPFDTGPAFEQFKSIGPQKPADWRYFPLARAHQGLLAGNRAAGYETLNIHLNHEQMQGWYAFDEGGKSGAGGWRHLNTTWNGDVAMPHGWAIAEFALLLRDCLLHEDGDRLVLFPGIPEDWFTNPAGIEIANLPTNFGRINVSYTCRANLATLRLDGATPPGGYLLMLPAKMKPIVKLNNTEIKPISPGCYPIPSTTNGIQVYFPQ